MPQERIRELLIIGLSQLHGAEEGMLRQLPLMAARATDPTLRALFDNHYRDTQRHLARLAAVFELRDERRRAMPAPAIRGLIEESRIRRELVVNADAVDLTLIDFARRLEHYEIAAYSGAIMYAERLGRPEPVGLLLDTLEEERGAAAQLGRISAAARGNAA